MLSKWGLELWVKEITEEATGTKEEPQTTSNGTPMSKVHEQRPTWVRSIVFFFLKGFCYHRH